MIRLKSDPIPDDIRQILDELQEEIDNESTFEEKVEKAGSLWKSKGGNEGEKAFEIIRKALYDMCVYVGICNYCEQNEANDIEHIHPKSFSRKRLSSGRIICLPANNVTPVTSLINVMFWITTMKLSL
ncbi:MAG: hypothetical protein HC887_06565 [Desulfobacteraceae bacterium]|nr:hypothetical protein [Desulfobacteraceae bacterium]